MGFDFQCPLCKKRLFSTQWVGDQVTLVTRCLKCKKYIQVEIVPRLDYKSRMYDAENNGNHPVTRGVPYAP